MFSVVFICKLVRDVSCEVKIRKGQILNDSYYYIKKSNCFPKIKTCRCTGYKVPLILVLELGRKSNRYYLLNCSQVYTRYRDHLEYNIIFNILRKIYNK